MNSKSIVRGLKLRGKVVRSGNGWYLLVTKYVNSNILKPNYEYEIDADGIIEIPKATDAESLKSGNSSDQAMTPYLKQVIVTSSEVPKIAC